MLVNFLIDLFRNPTLQQEFLKDPEVTLSQRGINAEAREQLLGKPHEQKRVAGELLHELRTMHLPGGAAALQALTQHARFNPSPWPTQMGARVRRITPASANRQQTLQLTVHGSRFAPGVTCWLKHQNTDLMIQVQQVDDPYKSNSTLQGQLLVGANAPLGPYTVLVRNPEQEQLFPLPNVFEVLA